MPVHTESRTTQEAIEKYKKDAFNKYVSDTSSVASASTPASNLGSTWSKHSRASVTPSESHTYRSSGSRHSAAPSRSGSVRSSSKHSSAGSTVSRSNSSANSHRSSSSAHSSLSRSNSAAGSHRSSSSQVSSSSSRRGSDAGSRAGSNYSSASSRASGHSSSSHRSGQLIPYSQDNQLTRNAYTPEGYGSGYSVNIPEGDHHDVQFDRKVYDDGNVYASHTSLRITHSVASYDSDDSDSDDETPTQSHFPPFSRTIEDFNPHYSSSVAGSVAGSHYSNSSNHSSCSRASGISRATTTRMIEGPPVSGSHYSGSVAGSHCSTSSHRSGSSRRGSDVSSLAGSMSGLSVAGSSASRHSTASHHSGLSRSGSHRSYH